MTVTATEGDAVASPAGTDMFGSTGGLDVSDEALAEKWVPDDTQADPDPVAPDEETEENAVQDEGDESPKGDEEPPKASESDPVEEELPEQYKGKTPAQIAKMVADAQAELGRRSNEVGTLRQQVEQLTAAQQQALAQITALQNEYAYEDYEEEEHLHNPLATYQQALVALDRGHTDIGSVEGFIDKVYDADPVLARKMDRDLSMRLAQAQSAARIEPLEQQAQVAAKRQASNELYAEEPDTKAYQQDIVELLTKPNPDVRYQLVQQAYQQAQTPAQFKQAMSAALQLARGADPTRSKTYSDAMERLKSESVVEEGNATPPPATVDEASRIRDEVFNRKSGDKALFAPIESFIKK